MDNTHRHSHINEHVSPVDSGLDLIREERWRQVNGEGFNADHDDGYTKCELALAAASYAVVGTHLLPDASPPFIWPWPASAWKPGDGSAKGRVQNLVKAGALIAAEIDRLQRIRQRTEG